MHDVLSRDASPVKLCCFTIFYLQFQNAMIACFRCISSFFIGIVISLLCVSVENVPNLQIFIEIVREALCANVKIKWEIHISG